ncbi:MAG TPA: Ig-like domain repeat protein, partial [Candidatus Polarisedimenticolia bacterium]|nr:Ig-like domain repeat protein [Candidatus Polarisedimenticolia bacterium]
ALPTTWTLSGSPDGTGIFLVDDDLDVYLNGVALIEQHVPPGTPRDHQPMQFTADVGDVLQIRVRDSYGICALLTPLYLTDASGRSAVATQGFDDGCLQPAGDRGVVFDTTIVISDLTPQPPGYQEALLPGSTLAGLVRGPGGLFYGVTYDRGLNNKGTIFSVTPDLATVTVLHNFNGADGRVPYYELTLDGFTLYGTTDNDGPAGGGTVFSFVPATGVFTTLASFGYPYAAPGGPLLVRGDFLYGTTGSFPGGSSIFRLRKDGTESPTFLHFFSPTDGQAPGALTYGPGGFLYGTATFGGLAACQPYPYDGCGTVFRIRPDGTGPGASGFEVIHSFTSATQKGRGFPQRKVVVANDGRLYGTTYRGVFRVNADPAVPDFQVLYTVPNTQGSQIFAPPIEGVGGRLFINQYDGYAGPGTGVGLIYSMTKAGADVTTHHVFTLAGGGQGPYGVMLADPVGTIYGTTEYSPSGPGTLFVIRGLSAAPPTTTTLVSSLNPSTIGQSVTFTATVTGVSPQGMVTFYDGAVSIGTANLASGATASLTTSALSAGPHAISAGYGGDGNNAPSTSNVVTQTVNKLTPTVVLGSSKNPSATGESVTFTATLPIGAGGSVSFLDGGVSFGSAAIANGQAQITTSALTAGGHSIVAHYDGDAQYAQADSAMLIQTVTTNSAPQIGVLFDQDIRWGQTLSLQVTATDPENDPITFALAGPPAGASITAGGLLTWTPTSAQLGAHTITVEASDGTLVGSRSFTVTVLKHETSITYTLPISGAPGPIELHATLYDAVAATYLAGKTVQFQLGTQSTSAVTDAAGVASGALQLAQPSGDVTLDASFAGDAAYQASSTTRNFRISLPPVITQVPPQQIPWGRTLSFPIQFSDPDGDLLGFFVVSQPSSLLVNWNGVNTTATVSWTPTVGQVGAQSLTVRVTDGVTSVFATIDITVLPHATGITSIAPGAAGNGPLVPTATLSDVEFGLPLAGKTLTFSVGAQSGSGTTDPWGIAGGPLTVSQPAGAAVLGASFAGDSDYAPTAATRALLVFDDADGDGLRDDWEINGVDVDGNGSIDLDLPAMGANPLHRDLFVETDWMERQRVCLVAACVPGDALEPQAAAVQALIAAFAAAPVPNPDGATGITLHLDAGPTSVMNPPTGALWGARGRGGRVPLDALLGATDAAGNYDWTEFEAIKAAQFDAARRGVFRYVVYANALGDTSASGISRGIPASDVVLAAGSGAWYFVNGFTGMTVTQERGVLMHELGHNLGLRHGGGDDLNNKPNYTSLMNYRYALVGLPPDGRPDYSRVLEPPADVTQPNGTVVTYYGFNDWPALVHSGGGIGDLATFPSPATTPVEILDPVELRAADAWARAGDGLARFRGPTLLLRGTGARALVVDVANLSNAAASYTVTIEDALLPAPLGGGVAVNPGGTMRVTLPIDTAALVAGEHPIVLTLKNPAGDVLSQTLHAITVLDPAIPADAALAQETAAALQAAPPDSGFDPAVIADTLAMIEAGLDESGAGDVGATLTITPAAGGDITLSWGASCSANDTDYAVYEGIVGHAYNHVARLCSTGGATSVTLTPPPGVNVYYLVVPRHGAFEGAYGHGVGGAAIPPGGGACAAQLVTTTCP